MHIAFGTKVPMPTTTGGKSITSSTGPREVSKTHAHSIRNQGSYANNSWWEKDYVINRP